MHEQSEYMDGMPIHANCIYAINEQGSKILKQNM